MATSTLDAAKYLYVGIFTDEKVLQFMQLLENLSDQCFQELHQIAAQKANLKLMPSELQPSSAYGIAFQTGLQAIQNWNSTVIQQEVDRLKQRWPYVEDMFKYTIVRYLQEVYSREKPQTISINVPPLRDFVHKFYIQVANNPLTRNLKYFSTFGMEKKSMIIDAMRSALFSIMEHQIDYQTTLQFNGNMVPVTETAAPLLSTPLRPWSVTAPRSDRKGSSVSVRNVTAPRSDRKKIVSVQDVTAPSPPPPPAPRSDRKSSVIDQNMLLPSKKDITQREKVVEDDTTEEPTLDEIVRRISDVDAKSSTTKSKEKKTQKEVQHEKPTPQPKEVEYRKPTPQPKEVQREKPISQEVQNKDQVLQSKETVKEKPKVMSKEEQHFPAPIPLQMAPSSSKKFLQALESAKKVAASEPAQDLKTIEVDVDHEAPADNEEPELFSENGEQENEDY
jgi:hypothetical protein